MNRKVIIAGDSGHGKVIADIVRACGDIVAGYLDDDTDKDTLGVISDWSKYSEYEFIIGIGRNGTREKVSRLMEGARWYTAVHPSAIVSPSAVIDIGTVIMPNAVINADSVVGMHCIINTGAIVEHDNRIGNFCHISVGAKLGGTVNIGDRTWIGMGATVINNHDICADCIIGAGGLVISDIEEAGTYVGVPVKRI